MTTGRSTISRSSSGLVILPGIDRRVEVANEIVYAISDGEFVKIGKVTNQSPYQRLATLQTGNPRRLVLVAYTVEMTERQAHSKLSRYHVRSEWFSLCAEVLEELDTWTWRLPG